MSTRRLHIGIAGAALLEGKVRVRELTDRGAPARSFALSRARPFPGRVLRDKGSDAKRESDVPRLQRLPARIDGTRHRAAPRSLSRSMCEKARCARTCSASRHALR